VEFSHESKDADPVAIVGKTFADSSEKSFSSSFSGFSC
jgi:hypothetical protein